MARDRDSDALDVQVFELDGMEDLEARIAQLEEKLGIADKDNDEKEDEPEVEFDEDTKDLDAAEREMKAHEDRLEEMERDRQDALEEEDDSDDDDFARIGDDSTIPEDDPVSDEVIDGTGIDLRICQFGLADKLIDDSDAADEIHILSGNVKKGIETMVTIAEADVTIPYADTYVGLQITRGLTGGAIITSATLAGVTPDSSHFRCWFYRFTLSAGNATLKNINLGQIMDVDITGYGD